jgi:hypothetical protein
MKTEEAAQKYRISFAAEGSHMERCSDLSFRAGAQFIIDRAYDKERMQRLFSHVCELTGHSLLENDMHEIIHILTSDKYEND